jgi:hypothetical protein
VAQRRERAHDQVGALRSVLDFESVRQAVAPVVDDQPILGVLAADLLVQGP